MSAAVVRLLQTAARRLLDEIDDDKKRERRLLVELANVRASRAHSQERLGELNEHLVSIGEQAVERSPMETMLSTLSGMTYAVDILTGETP